MSGGADGVAGSNDRDPDRTSGPGLFVGHWLGFAVMSSKSFLATPRSVATCVVWPALGDAESNRRLALLHQFEATQWWPEAQLRTAQMAQAEQVIRHAQRTTPLHAERLRAAVAMPRGSFDWDVFSRIPVIGRAEMRLAGRDAFSREPPHAHGPLAERTTSGSTGMPLRMWWTELVGIVDDTLTLRGHVWQGRDFAAKAAMISRPRQTQPLKPGERMDWAPGFRTGPAVVIPIAQTATELLAALDREQPAYLVSTPTVIAEIAQACRRRGRGIAGLREVTTVGEVLQEWHRAIIGEGLAVATVDLYATEEVGKIAMQCEAGSLHVMAENVIVEVLDDAGAACAPGEVGRVVVTSLVNFATPCIRYAIGDHAEVGTACACGRGLPVLRRVIGRSRAMLVRPDGARQFPRLAPLTRLLLELDIARYQLAQVAPSRLELRLVGARPLDAAMMARVAGVLQEVAGFPVEATVAYRDSIARSASGKYEDFRSELGGGAAPGNDAA